MQGIKIKKSFWFVDDRFAYFSIDDSERTERISVGANMTAFRW